MPKWLHKVIGKREDEERIRDSFIAEIEKLGIEEAKIAFENALSILGDSKVKVTRSSKTLDTSTFSKSIHDFFSTYEKIDPITTVRLKVE